MEPRRVSTFVSMFAVPPPPLASSCCSFSPAASVKDDRLSRAMRPFFLSCAAVSCVMLCLSSYEPLCSLDRLSDRDGSDGSTAH
eukprot:6105591-Prymnesium_polylepis.1